jgi:hypothetical protein
MRPRRDQVSHGPSFPCSWLLALWRPVRLIRHHHQRATPPRFVTTIHEQTGELRFLLQYHTYTTTTPQLHRNLNLHMPSHHNYIYVMCLRVVLSVLGEGRVGRCSAAGALGSVGAAACPRRRLRLLLLADHFVCLLYWQSTCDRSSIGNRCR